MSGWHQLSKDSRKLLGNLLECALDSLVLAAVEMLDELFDGLLRGVQLLSSFHEVLLLGSEVVVLLESLLVHVLVLLQSLVDLLELGRDLE